jgi:hypothetical protein
MLGLIKRKIKKYTRNAIPMIINGYIIAFFSWDKLIPSIP